MIIPVRCFTCNKVVGNKWETYVSTVAKYKSLGETDMSACNKALDEALLTKYCCRRMLLSHIDIIDTLLLYSSSNNNNEDYYINGINN